VNLAQAVDPERLDREERPREPSPRPPMGLVTHEQNLTRFDRVLAPRLEQPRRGPRPRP